MSEKPIIFSGEMVRAILDGRKTQMRRVIKPQPDTHALISGPHENGGIYIQKFLGDINHDWIPCPHGKPGDRLWVRETFAPNLGTDGGVLYRADYGGALAVHTIDLKTGEYTVHMTKWKPSIHMPRWASRITLEITDVRVERLQSITENDAKAEGVELTDDITGCADDLNGSYKKAFSYLWDKINGKKHPWLSNPWVWVIEFKKI